jgi:hypothetical protein
MLNRIAITAMIWAFGNYLVTQLSFYENPACGHEPIEEGV